MRDFSEFVVLVSATLIAAAAATGIGLGIGLVLAKLGGLF